jgi:hypothetical protein
LGSGELWQTGANGEAPILVRAIRHARVKLARA